MTDPRAVVTSERGTWLLLAGLVILSTGPSIFNGFSFDDVPIILENSQVHSLAAPWEYAQQSYWPPHNLGAAYRPWTIWMFALQWQLAAGAPWVFHLVSILLTFAVTAAVYRLAMHRLPRPAALMAAALFAVHPVHVEATGNLVGQGELWMTLFVLLACLVYLRVRSEDKLPTSGARLAIAGLTILAAAAKEQGFVLPALILLLELTDRREATLRSRLSAAGPTVAMALAAAVALLLGRYAVLGKLGAGAAAAGLDTLSFTERALVMAPLITEWVRLLIWPRSLEAQYSPPAYGAMPDSVAPVLIGAGFLVAAVVLAVRARRTTPATTLGLTWIGVALLPVANLLFPTGIVIAERTLFLPSVGAVLAGAGGATWIASRIPRSMPLLASLTCLLVGLGAARSHSRQAVWRDSPTTFAQTVIDGPRSYRGFQMYAIELSRRGDMARADSMYARAAHLYDGSPRLFEEWGQLHRAAGDCGTAVEILRRGLDRHPGETTMRSRLFECLIVLGQYQNALDIAEAGIGLGQAEFEGAAERARARLTP